MAILRRGGLTTIVALIALVNVLYLGYSLLPQLPKSYFYGGGEPEYYVLHKDRVNSSVLGPLNSLQKIHEYEILQHLTTEIKLSEHGNQLSEKAKQDIADALTSQYKKELQHQVEQDYSYFYFRQLQKTYSLLEDLKAKYYEENKESIRSSVMGDVLRGLGPEVLKKADESLLKQESKKDYYTYLILDVLASNGPKLPPVEYSRQGKGIGGNMFREVINPPYSREFLTKSRMNLHPQELEDLRNNHDLVVKMLQTLEKPSQHFFSGDGIVVSGGGPYLTGAIINIVQLRELDSQLPIELILNTEDEYDKYVCETLMPKLNAKCVVIEREVGSDALRVLGLSKFQLKVLGLLVSSFDNTIALDADNLPIKNVDFLLNTEPFLSTKWVLWPDIWHKGMSPLFYDIARIKVGEPVRRYGLQNDRPMAEYVGKDKNTDVMFHDLEGALPPMGGETGQMVFSKREHFRAFLLSLYYNIHGTDFYYPLLYQGTYGVGDRETFVPALHVMKESYHLSKYQVWLAGYEASEVTTRGETRHFMEESTLVQHDPAQSMEFYEKWEAFLAEKNLDTRLYPFQENNYTSVLYSEFLQVHPDAEPDVLFLHLHRPKVNPVLNLLPEVSEKFGDLLSTQRFLDDHGKYTKYFGATDWELRFHAISQWVVCSALSSNHYWTKIVQVDREELCQSVTRHVEFLRGSSKDVLAANLTVPTHI